MLTNSKKPVSTVADLQGLVIRVPKNEIMIETYKSWGINPTPMAWGETFTAVQQKTIDGLEIPVPVIYQNKYYEVTKYLSLTNHTYSPLVFMISKKTWDKMPADVQKAVRESVTETIPIQRSKNAKNTDDLLKELKAKGMEINAVDNPEAFKEKVKPMYSEFEGKIGKDVFDALFKATK